MALINEILATFDQASGGVQAGFRPAHAKGAMYAGTFKPAAAAAKLTKAPHANQPSTPIAIRFSTSGGSPTIAENDPKAAPFGLAIRFHLAEHVHTDIVSHSHNGFPARTGEEFLEFLRAAVASGAPNAPNPPPIVAFLGAHPAARAFVEAPKPIPTSLARQAYFAVTAFKFTNAAGESKFGRFRIIPDAGTEFLTADQAAKKTADFLSAEMSERLAKGPVGFRIQVQLAEAGDKVDDATSVWPESRTLVEFGALTITERVDELEPERRKIIFDPLPRVDGIDSAGDPLTDVRADLYLLSGRRRRSDSR
jgi:catalase